MALVLCCTPALARLNDGSQFTLKVPIGYPIHDAHQAPVQARSTKLLLAHWVTLSPGLHKIVAR